MWFHSQLLIWCCGRWAIMTCECWQWSAGSFKSWTKFKLFALKIILPKAAAWSDLLKQYAWFLITGREVYFWDIFGLLIQSNHSWSLILDISSTSPTLPGCLVDNSWLSVLLSSLRYVQHIYSTVLRTRMSSTTKMILHVNGKTAKRIPRCTVSNVDKSCAVHIRTFTNSSCPGKDGIWYCIWSEFFCLQERTTQSIGECYVTNIFHSNAYMGSFLGSTSALLQTVMVSAVVCPHPGLNYYTQSETYSIRCFWAITYLIRFSQ